MHTPRQGLSHGLLSSLSKTTTQATSVLWQPRTLAKLLPDISCYVDRGHETLLRTEFSSDLWKVWNGLPIQIIDDTAIATKKPAYSHVYYQIKHEKRGFLKYLTIKPARQHGRAEGNSLQSATGLVWHCEPSWQIEKGRAGSQGTTIGRIYGHELVKKWTHDAVLLVPITNLNKYCRVLVVWG